MNLIDDWTHIYKLKEKYELLIPIMRVLSLSSNTIKTLNEETSFGRMVHHEFLWKGHELEMKLVKLQEALLTLYKTLFYLSPASKSV